MKQRIPNLLSLSRLLATVLVVILVLINQPWAFLVATLLFFLASVTDFFDGYLARRCLVWPSVWFVLPGPGDKIFVAAILIALVQIGLVPAWIVIIIVSREFLVTGLRSMAAARNKVIPAGTWGKQKTFITLVAIGGLLLAKGLGAQYLSLFPPILVFNSQTLNLPSILLFTADVLLLLPVFWTILSGFEYSITP